MTAALLALPVLAARPRIRPRGGRFLFGLGHGGVAGALVAVAVVVVLVLLAVWLYRRR